MRLKIIIGLFLSLSLGNSVLASDDAHAIFKQILENDNIKELLSAKCQLEIYRTDGHLYKTEDWEDVFSLTYKELEKRFVEYIDSCEIDLSFTSLLLKDNLILNAVCYAYKFGYEEMKKKYTSTELRLSWQIYNLNKFINILESFKLLVSV